MSRRQRHAEARARARIAAERYLLSFGDSEPGPDELHGRLDACADHLRRNLGLGDQMAADTALTAWAELQGRRARCYVDLEASSPHLIFVVDPMAKTRRAITVVDLLRVIGPRSVART